MEDRGYCVRVRSDLYPLFEGKRPPLRRLDIELTERCNNACIHCYINLPEADRPALERELATSVLKGILDEAASLGCLSVKFTGGEPLLREDFEDLYLHARGLGLKVYLFTNATRLSPPIVDLFARVPPLEKIEVSIYGVREESYEGVTRVRGSFQAVMRGIGLLLERKVPFVVKSAVLPPNRGELEELEKWAEGLPWMDRPVSWVSGFDLRARRDSEARNEDLRAFRLDGRDTIAILSRDTDSYLKDMKAFGARFMRPPGKRLLTCGAGNGTACVDAYGSLQPCLLLRHPASIYDLKKGSLKRAMKEFFPELRLKEATNPHYLKRCACCFIKSLCEQCPAKSWMEHGTLDTPVDYLCELAHFQATDLGLLRSGEKGWEVEDWESRIRSLMERPE
jgi:radical SAM protein with 4Fe4S-binding SPASM domain